MLHPFIKFVWHTFWTFIFVLLGFVALRANQRPDWFVYLVCVVGWALMMLMPRYFSKLYDWATVKDERLRFRRILILSPFGSAAVYLFATAIFGFGVWVGVGAVVIIIGFWIYVHFPRG